MAKLRWVHLAQLHEHYATKESSASSLRRLAAVRGKEGVDVVVISGDVVHAGHAREYDRALDFLREVRSRLTVGRRKPVVLAVPGNHDYDRAHKTSGLSARLMARWHEDDGLRREIFLEGNDELREIVTRGFSGFERWHVRVRPASTTRGLLPGDHSFTVELPAATVGLVGLNSELGTVGSMHERQPATISRAQVDAATGGDARVFARRCTVVLVALHAGPQRLDASGVETLHEAFGESSVLLSGAGVPLTDARSNRGALTWLGVLPASIGSGSIETSTLSVRVAVRSPQVGEIGVGFSLRGRASATPRPAGPLAAVREINLSNFRGLERITIPLAAPSDTHLGGRWTCIVGLNGAGKSSVLQGLALTLLSEREVIELGLERIKRLRRRDGAAALDASAVVRMANGGTRTLRIDEAGPVSRGSSGTLVVGYGATRNLSDTPDASQSNLSARVRRVLTLFDPLAHLARVEALTADGAGSTLLSLIEQLARAILPGDVEFVARAGRAAFRQRGQEIDAVDLPDGFRSTLAWLADLAAAWLEHAPPETGDDIAAIEAIVLIDEIDLHLHPSLQRSLVARVRSALPRCQFVVTTHSPLILANFHESEIVVLDSDAPGGLRTVDRPILGFSMDQIYEWLMETSPTSGFLESQLSMPEEQRALTPAQIAEALTASPTVDSVAADKLNRRRRQLLDRLRKGDL